MTDKKIPANINFTKADRAEFERRMREYCGDSGAVFDSDRTEMDVQALFKSAKRGLEKYRR